MSVRAARLALLFALACGVTTPPPVEAQSPTPLNRCSGPGGGTVYTDRRCDEVGATTRIPGDAPRSGAMAAGRGGCARTVQDLIYQVSSAIENHDANRLGAVYHWVGMDTDQGYRILDRLQVIADRPLVDIVPLHAARASRPPAAEDTAPPSPTSAGSPTGDPLRDTAGRTRAPPTTEMSDDAPLPRTPVDPELYPQTSVRRVPVGLRLEQTLTNGSTPARTVLGLRRHLECWWITF